MAYWNAPFSPSLNGAFSFLNQLSLRDLFPPLAPLIGLLLLLDWPRRPQLTLPVAIITTGVSGMAFDLIVVFAFQTLCGYVYQHIGLLTTAFMAGLGLGGLLMTRGIARIQREWRWLIGVELAILLYWAGLPPLLALLYARPGWSLPHPALLVLNALAGLLVGCSMPVTWQAPSRAQYWCR